MGAVAEQLTGAADRRSCKEGAPRDGCALCFRRKARREAAGSPAKRYTYLALLALNDLLCHLRNLFALSGLGLFPDRCELGRLQRVSRQQASHVGIQCARCLLKRLLGVCADTALQHRKVAGGHVKAVREPLQRQPAVLAPLADEGLPALDGLEFWHLALRSAAHVRCNYSLYMNRELTALQRTVPLHSFLSGS